MSSIADIQRSGFASTVGFEVRRLLLVFGHKPETLVRQQSQGSLEIKQLPVPQMIITMHPDRGFMVVPGWRGSILGWPAAAGLLDWGFSGLVREYKKSLSS